MALVCQGLGWFDDGTARIRFREVRWQKGRGDRLRFRKLGSGLGFLVVGSKAGLMGFGLR